MRVCGLVVLEGEFSCSRSAITSNTKCHVSRQRLPVDSARFIRPLRALRARFSWNDRRGARCGCRDEKSVEALAEAARLRSRQWLSISPRGRRLNRKLPMNRDDRWKLALLKCLVIFFSPQPEHRAEDRRSSTFFDPCRGQLRWNNSRNSP